MTNDTITPEPKKKICWQATASALCVLAVVVFYISIMLAPKSIGANSDFAENVIPVVLLCLSVASPLFGIWALLRIDLSNNFYGGKALALLAMVLSSIILGFMAPAQMIGRSYEPYMSTVSPRQIGRAIELYSQKHEGQLPNLENWCDVLITQADIDPDYFICYGSDAKWGESSFALNKAVVGMKLSEIPENMVLLFEVKTGNANAQRDFPVSKRAFMKDKENKSHKSDLVYKDQWNQVGGPELLSVTNHHREGCNILFGDMSVKFVEPEKLPNLQWTREGQIDFNWAQLLSTRNHQRILVYKSLAIGFMGVIVVVGMVKILRRFYLRKYWRFVTLLGIVSGGVGCFFGMLAEALYQGKSPYPGIISGGMVGLAVGVCYATILAHTPGQKKTQVGFKGYATSLGMATGVVCSTLVHLILMIGHEEKTPLGMIGGLPFGILAGAIIGMISGGEVKKHCPGEVEGNACDSVTG